MLADTIRNAVEVLHQQGQRISVRTVHALNGGSLRDAHRLLMEVLPLLRIEEHPDVQDVRARLRALEGEGADLQRLVDAQQRTVTVLQAELEATENAVFLGQQPASALERVQTALRGALAELHADQANLAAHQAKEARLTGVAQAVEADTTAIVEQHLWEAYGEEVRAVYRSFLELIDRLQRMRALQEHARREFPHRTVLPPLQTSPGHKILYLSGERSRPYVDMDDDRLTGSPRSPGRGGLGEW